MTVPTYARSTGWLRIAVPITFLIAIGLYSAFPHPVRDPSQLKALAAESRRLMAAHPIQAPGQTAEIPRAEWPAAIAGLNPYAVTVHHGAVEIATKPSFDGGWGYGFAADKRDLPLPAACWSVLGHGIYWHGLC